MDDLVVEIVKFAPAVVVMAWVILRQDKRIDRLLDMLEKRMNEQLQSTQASTGQEETD